MKPRDQVIDEIVAERKARFSEDISREEAERMLGRLVDFFYLLDRLDKKYGASMLSSGQQSAGEECEDQSLWWSGT